MGSTSATLVKRSPLAGILLRPLGHGYWGVEQKEDGFTFFDKGGKRLAFSELAGSPRETKALGFQVACFPLKGGADIKIVGLNSNAIG
jgi:DNA helicase-4